MNALRRHQKPVERLPVRRYAVMLFLLTALMHRQVPLPAHAALLLLYRDRVVAGGPAGTRPHLAGGRARLGTVPFAAQASPLGLAGAQVVALEPASAIDALSDRYRSFVFL